MRRINPIGRISLVLVILILLPAVIYISFETATLSESEEMIREVYRQQLDAVLFSVNQYVEDYIGSWRNRVNTSLNAGQTDFDGLMAQLTGVEVFLLWGYDMQLISEISSSENTDRIHRFIADSLDLLERRVKQLRDYQAAGYQKIQPMIFKEKETAGSRDLLLLLFTHSNYQNQPVVVGLILPVNYFMETVIRAKLDDLAGKRFYLGIFDQKTRQAVLPGQELKFMDAKQQKGIWLLPGYSIGIKLAEADIEDLAQERFYRDVIVIAIIFVLFLLGAWLILRNVKKEIHLAQMKSDFVSNVSHELRTPLSLIRMYTETLEMGRIVSEEKRMSYYQIIGQETERLTRLINNILNFSRIESGKKIYKPENIEINRVVEKIVDTYRVHVEHEGVKLNIEPGRNLKLVYADPGALSEALINLLDNAIKYSDDRKEITISTFECEKGVCLSISDRGIGIEEQHLSHIFDKFYRVPTGAVHNTKGSGLGLALVRHIMDAHGGSIDVKSKPGVGTTFSLIFPITKKISESGG